MQQIKRRPVSGQPANPPFSPSAGTDNINPPQQAHIPNPASHPRPDQQAQQQYIPASYTHQPKPIPEPQYVPIPGTLYDIGDDGSRHQDTGATMAAQYNAVMINAGIAGNHKFVTERAVEEAGASDILLRWNFITDGSQPQYTFAMQRLGLPREHFEADIARLYRLYDDGRFGTMQDTWCCGPARMGGDKMDGDKKFIDPALPGINQKMQNAGIPMAYSYKIHWQTRPVLHELVLQNVPI